MNTSCACTDNLVFLNWACLPNSALLHLMLKDLQWRQWLFHLLSVFVWRTEQMNSSCIYFYVSAISNSVYANLETIEETAAFNTAFCRTAVVLQDNGGALILCFNIFTQQSIGASLLRLMLCFRVWVMLPHKKHTLTLC